MLRDICRDDSAEYDVAYAGQCSDDGMKSMEQLYSMKAKAGGGQATIINPQ